MTEPREHEPDPAPPTQPVALPQDGSADVDAGLDPDTLHLAFAAVSDVGRIRKDNQDSGYAGPWLLSVCDGVGGAARGDIASSTAISELRKLDAAPNSGGSGADGDLLDRVTLALHDAHATIGRLVDDEPSINGTSTTATVALFDGRRVGIGHVGDSRAYLFRDGEISQLTTDHTFVQSLLDEGRITAAEARVHPHRNLILKALDGIHEAEPDLFVLELTPGDRLFLCSDGACGVLDDGRLADILSGGSPDYASVELVRASLDAGSSDNVTCIVADVAAGPAPTADAPDALEPLVVGAAAEMPQLRVRSQTPRSLFRGHRSGDTGELEPIEADIPDEVPFAIPTDPIRPDQAEAARYAPRAPERRVGLRRLLVLIVVVGVIWAVLATAWTFTQHQYYIGQRDGTVVIYRGVQADLPGVDLSTVVETSDLSMSRLYDVDQQRVLDGIPADDVADAERKLTELGSNQVPDSSSGDSNSGGGSTDQPSSSPSVSPSDQPTTQGGAPGATISSPAGSPASTGGG